MKYTCFIGIVLFMVPLLHILTLWHFANEVTKVVCGHTGLCQVQDHIQEDTLTVRGLSYAKKSSKKSSKKKTKSTIKEDDEPPFVDDGESTIDDLLTPLQTQVYAKHNKPSLIFMYHEDDDASVDSLVEFKKTEQKLRGYANFVTIACHKEGFEDMMPACKQELNSGIFPLISAMVPPYRRKNPYTKKLEDNQEIPYGTRPKTSKSMIKFLQNIFPNFAELISSKKEYKEKVLNEKAINKVVLFSDKLDKSKQPPLIYKALTNHFKDKLEFFTIDTGKFKNYPIEATIAVIAKHDQEGEELDDDQNNLANLLSSTGSDNYEVDEDEKIVRYTGQINIQELITFLDAVALNSEYSPEQKVKSNEERRSPYTIVNHKNYTRGLVDDYRTQIVYFDTKFDEIKDSFDVVAANLHGPVNVVFFDCNKKESQELAKTKFNVKRFPNILVWATGVDKDMDNALEINSGIEPDDLIDVVLETEIKDNLKDVSDSMISSILLTNAMQLRKTTLVYLYEDGHEIPLAFRAVSMHPRIKENFDFVAIKNPGEMTRQQFQVKKMPIIIGGLPPPEGMESMDVAGGGNLQTMIYNGDTTDYYEVLSYNLGVADMFYPVKEDDKTKAENKPPVESVKFQEVTANNFDEICESKKGICVIAFLSGSLYNEIDISDHQERLEILDERNKESSGQFKYMWMNASCHDYALLHFDLSPMALPTLVIYSPSQQKYAKMITSFSKENIIDFEKSFEGVGNTRIAVYDSKVRFTDIIRDIDCPNLQLDSDLTDDMIMSEDDEEIMREIMEEERRKREEQGLEDDEDKPKKKKKKKSKKKKSKK